MKDTREPREPEFKGWTLVYWAVAINTVVVIVALWVFSRVFG